jgi:hypothetical protein
MQVTTIGLDIAKNAFQVHAIDSEDKVVVRKQPRRGQDGEPECSWMIKYEYVGTCTPVA